MEPFSHHQILTPSNVSAAWCRLLLLMWNKKEISELDATLTRVPLTLTFDLESSRSNCISGMEGLIVMEQKGWEWIIRIPDVKHNHYVT